MSYFSDDVYKDDNDLSAHIEQMVQDSKASSSILRDEVWPRGYRYYHNIHDPKMFKGTDALPGPGGDFPLDSSVFRALTHYEVENSVARERPAILNADPPWRVVPYIDDIDFCDKDMMWKHAAAVQHLLHNQWIRDVRAPKLIGPVLREAFLYGTCILRVEWMRRYAPTWGQIPHVDGTAYPDGVPDDVAEKGGRRTWAFGKLNRVGPRRPAEDRARVNIVPWPNWFPDPFGRSIDGENDTQPIRACAELLIMPDDALIDWIMSSKNRGWNRTFYKRNGELDTKKLRKKIDEVSGGVTDNDDWIKRQQMDVGKLSTSGYGTTRANDRLVRIYAFSENWPEPRYILSAGKPGAGLTLLDEVGEDHPGLMAGIGYVLVKPIPLANELFGLSKVEQMAGAQHEMNVLVNLRISALSRSVSGITIISTQGGLHARDFLSQPGGFVELNGYYDPAKQVHHIDFADPGATIYREVDELRSDATLNFGNTDPMMGNANAQTPDTARGLATTVEMGTIRQTMESEEMGLCFAQVGEKLLALDRQFITAPTYARIAGKKGADAWAVINPDMIGTRFEPLTFDTRPVVVNPALQEQKFVNFAQLWGQAQGFPVGLAMRTHAKMLRIPDAEQYGGPPVNDAEWENIEFVRSGKFRGVLGADAHAFHQQAMSRPEIIHVAQAGGEATSEWNKHYEAHEAAKAGAMQQGAGAPPEPQPNEPPPPEAPQNAPMAASPAGGLTIPMSPTASEPAA